MYHDWIVFEVEQWEGELKLNSREAKRAEWVDDLKIKEYVRQLEEFVHSFGLELAQGNLPVIVKATNESDNWKTRPGLEPPMYFLFKELGII